MTTREEAKAKLDALSDTEFQQVADLLEAQERQHQAEVQELARLLDALSEPLPEDEKRELLSDLERRPLRSAPPGDDA